MYKKSFYIETPVGNNQFSYEKRSNKKIFITSLKKGLNISLGKKIVFEDYDFNGKLISAYGLNNFFEFFWKQKKIYLFDNHNHAFYFWYKEYFETKKQFLLIHIDEHSDLREPNKYLKFDSKTTLQDIFNYTNYCLNVGNYIKPAIKTGLIKDMIQIRSLENLENINYDLIKKYKGNIILNLDLDFFHPSLDYIDYNFKKTTILKLADFSNFITVASSPFFINQKLAIKVFKDIFSV